MEKRKKVIVFFVAIVLVSASWFFWRQSNAKNVKQIKLNESDIFIRILSH